MSLYNNYLDEKMNIFGYLFVVKIIAKEIKN